MSADGSSSQNGREKTSHNNKMENIIPQTVNASGATSDSENMGERQCCKHGRYFCDALKAMITRQIFLFHCILAVWQVTLVTSDLYWLMSLTFIGLIIETLVVLLKRRGQEWSWFQWSVMLYLIGVVPPIWILELHKLGRWVQLRNSTLATNSLNYQIIQVDGIVPFQMAPDDWVVALEQTLLVLIIVGRWLMPKGDLTRNQLSSLLLVHLGTASDIVDFLTLLAEEDILGTDENDFVYAILAVWSWSLVQFPFVVTAKKENQSDVDALDDEEEETENRIPTALKRFKAKMKEALQSVHDFLETEAWGIFVSMMMQDGPFVVMRMTAILRYRVVTYTNYFFACKNSLVLLLQIYRLLSIYHEHKKAKQEKENNFKNGMKLKRLYNKVWDAEQIKAVSVKSDPYGRRRKEVKVSSEVDME